MESENIPKEEGVGQVAPVVMQEVEGNHEDKPAQLQSDKEDNENSKSVSNSPSNSPSSDHESDGNNRVPTDPTKTEAQNTNQVSKTRYKYCCKVCKHTDRGKKACVCVVPLSERRTVFGGQGCQTCRCKGCSIEDFVSRGEDPVYKVVKINKEDIFDPKRLCCKKCMKAFYNKGKPCFCQIPPKDRKGKLSSNGCQLCNCRGCNTEQYKGPTKQRERQRKRESSKSRSRDRKKRHHRSRTPSRRSSSSEVNVKDLNLNNFDRSILGNMIINEFRVFPGLLGFGIPQRSQSYILNKPK